MSRELVPGQCRQHDLKKI